MQITQEQVNLCFSIADVCRMIGLIPSGNNYRTAKESIKGLIIIKFSKTNYGSNWQNIFVHMGTVYCF